MATARYPSDNPALHSPVIFTADLKLLKAVAAFRQMGISQLVALLYSPGCLTSVRSRMKRLADLGLVNRVCLPREDGTGRGVAVFGLTGRGVRLIRTHGGWVRGGHRAGDDVRRTIATLRHSLAVIDIVIAATRLSKHNPCFRLVDRVSEEEFRREPGYTHVNYETVAVQPDAWLDIRHLGLGWWERLPLLVELDRGTGGERTIRLKVRKYLQWTSFGYTDRFGAGDPRVLFVSPGNDQRTAQLKRWLEAELKERGARSLRRMFWVTSADAAAVAPGEFFFGPRWQRPFETEYLPLFVPGRLQESQSIDYLYAWGLTEADLTPQITLYERPRYVSL